MKKVSTKQFDQIYIHRWYRNDLYRVHLDALDSDCVVVAFKQRTPASTKENSNLSNHQLLRLHHSML